MFKKIILTSLLAVSTTSAFANGGTYHMPVPAGDYNPNFYVSAFGGIGLTPNVESSLPYKNPGYTVGAALGIKASEFRFELQFAHMSTSITDSKAARDFGFYLDSKRSATSILSSMFNVYYDFDGLMKDISPYIGVGIGYAYVNDKFQYHVQNDYLILDGKDSESTNAFAYQAIVGAKAKLPIHNVSAFVDYRYYGTTKGDRDKAYGNHTINFGLMYAFS